MKPINATMIKVNCDGEDKERKGMEQPVSDGIEASAIYFKAKVFGNC